MTRLAVAIPVDVPIIGPIVRGVSNFVGGTVSKAVKTGFRWIVEYVIGAFVNAAKSLIEQLAAFFDRSSTVSLTDGWWTGPAAQNLLVTVERVSLVLMGLFVLLAVADGIIHADIGDMVRTVFVQVPLSLFATATLVAFTTVILESSDALAGAFLGAPLSGDVFTAAFGNADAVIKAGLLGPVLVVLFTIGALLVWIELVIRASLIYLLIMLAPVVLAARIWAPARRSWRRLVDVTLALIVAKPVIAIALALGTAAIGRDGVTSVAGPGEVAGSQISGMLTAAVLMLLATFAPFVVLKLLPIVETAIVAQGIRSAPLNAGMKAAQASYYGRMLAGGAGRGGGSSGSSGGGGGGGGGSSTGMPSAEQQSDTISRLTNQAQRTASGVASGTEPAGGKSDGAPQQSTPRRPSRPSPPAPTRQDENGENGERP